MNHGTGARLPKDVAARERLRRAQQQEAQAVGAVCTAEQALAAARRKRDRAVAAADAVVTGAERKLAVAQSGLVDVSGLERAGALLGLTRTALRKARSLAMSADRDGAAA